MLSLRSSLMVIFVLLVAAPLGFFWAWPHSQALQHEVADVKDRHLLLARNMGRALQRYHRDTVGAFDYAADSLLLGLKLPDTRAMLTNLRFRSVCLFDAASGRLVRGLHGLTGCAETISPGTSKLIGEFAVDGQTVMTPVHPSSKGDPVICWVRRSGKHLVVGAIDTQYFVEHGRSIAFGQHGHAVIVDHTGRVLSHPVPKWEAEMRDLSKLEIVQDMIAGRTGIKQFYSPAFRDDMIAGYSTVEGAGWGIMVPQPIAELKENVNQVQRSALSIFAMSLLMAALIACRAAFTLLNPVTRVIEGAAAMAQGATQVRLPTPGRLAPRELADLTATFNAMAENVARARSGEAQAREIAERANQSKTDFLRTVTHELRSPLNAVVGFSDMLASGKAGALGSGASKACIEDIRSGARLMLSLTNDLLDLARIEAGQYQLASEIVDLGVIADRAARFAKPAAEARSAAVSVEIPSDLPAVRGDERALFQSLLNLVSNAVKYGRDGGQVTVAASVTAPGGIRITVGDNGPGIAADDIPRVMEPFQRIAGHSNKDATGTGLGLPIVRKLVELHGGAFSLESTLGVGTRGIIELPSSRVIADAPFLEAAE